MNKKYVSGRPIPTTNADINKELNEVKNNYSIFHINSKYKATLLLIFVTGFYLHTWHYNLVSIALYGAVGIGFVAIGGNVLLRLAFKLEDFKILQATRIEAQNKAMMFTASHKEQVFQISSNTVIPVHTIKPQLPQLPELSEAEALVPKLDLLTELTTDNPKRVLIKGVSGAGKSNLLQHIVNRWLDSGYVTVIDPHSKPKQWGNATVYGGGGDFDAISQAMDSFILEMTNRYKQLFNGDKTEADFVPFTIIIDELMSIANQCDNAKTTLVRLITESRKANFNLFVGVHSDRVEALGLKGLGDIRQGLTMVRLHNDNGLRTATLDYGKGEIDATIPPLFGGYTSNGSHVLELPIVAPPLSSEDLEIYELKQAGLSYNKIALQVYSSKGGQQTKLIKDAIKRVETHKGVSNGKV